MQIKQASTAETSTTLAAARRSERWACGLLIGGPLTVLLWAGVPENIKSKMLPPLGIAGTVIGLMFQRGVVKVREGRMAVGDLPEVVKGLALLPANEMQTLALLKPLIEGGVNPESLLRLKPALEGAMDITELPQVRAAIECGVRAAKPDMHEQVREMAMRQASDFRGSGIVPPPTRVLDPSWEAPI